MHLYPTYEEQKSGRKITHILFNIIKSGGSNKELPSLNIFIKKEVYHNGENRLIINAWEIKNEKGYIMVQMIDKEQSTITDKIHKSQLQKMIEYSDSRPKLFV